MSVETRSMILSLEDYERIFRVTHGVLLAEQGDPARACVYFGVIEPCCWSTITSCVRHQ
jgi:hypothetical protein